MRIEIYGRPLCDACEAVVNYIELANVPYEYYNIEQMTPTDLMELITKRVEGARHVPIIFIDGRKVENLDELKKYFEFNGITPNILG